MPIPKTCYLCSLGGVVNQEYEGIKLQKWFIACKKGINVVFRFLYSEIS